MNRIFYILIFCCSVYAGDLEPSSDPASTMHTLDEIYSLILDTNNKVNSASWGIYKAGVAKTGQTKCYNSAGTEISCSGTGQDGEYQKGVDFVTPRFKDNNDQTITDFMASLMWTKDANIYSQKVWSQALIDCNSCEVGEHNDWRLPNRNELDSILNLQYIYPALGNMDWTAKMTDNSPFLNVQDNYYWTSTTHMNSTQAAWIISLDFGHDKGQDKSESHYVWCVRGGPD